jgi:hypothetical protein
LHFTSGSLSPCIKSVSSKNECVVLPWKTK